MENQASWSSGHSNRVSGQTVVAAVPGSWPRGLSSPPENEELLSTSDITLRHMFFVIQSLLAESQVNVALRLVDEITSEATFTHLLDMQLAAASSDLSQRLLDFISLEKANVAFVFDNIHKMIQGVRPKVDEASDNLLAKLGTTHPRDGSLQANNMATMALRSSSSSKSSGTKSPDPYAGKPKAPANPGEQKHRMSTAQRPTPIKSGGRHTIGASSLRYSVLGAESLSKPKGVGDLQLGASVPLAGPRRSSNSASLSPIKHERVSIMSPMGNLSQVHQGNMSQVEAVGQQRRSSELAERPERPHPRVSLTQALGLKPVLMSTMNPISPTRSSDKLAMKPPATDGQARSSSKKQEDTGNRPQSPESTGVSSANQAVPQPQTVEFTESDFGDQSSSDESMMVEDDINDVDIACMQPGNVTVQDIHEMEGPSSGWPEFRATSPIPPSSPSPTPFEHMRSSLASSQSRPESCPPRSSMQEFHNIMASEPTFGVDSNRPSRSRFHMTSSARSSRSLEDVDSPRQRANSWPPTSRFGLEDAMLSRKTDSMDSDEMTAENQASLNSSVDKFYLYDPVDANLKRSPSLPASLKATRFALPSISPDPSPLNNPQASAEAEESDSDKAAPTREAKKPSPLSVPTTATASQELLSIVARRKSVLSQVSHHTVHTIHSRRDKQADTHPLFKMKKKTMSATKYFLTGETLEEDQAAYLGLPSHSFIIHPSSMFRMSWDCVSLVIILLESLILPMGLCFNMYPPNFIMWISTAFFTPDLILNFFTGFYSNGLLIMRQRLILKRYVMGWFVVDFCSTVPWEVIFSRQSGNASFMLKFVKIGKLMRVLRLLRIFKLKTLIQRVEDMFSSYIVLFTLSIAKTVTSYVLFCHWIACIWGFIGDYDGEAPMYDRTTCEPDGPCENGLGVNDSPWRRRYGLDSTNAADQYLVSLQFATALLTGAELQLMPGRTFERCFVTCMTIVSFLVCSMIISQIVVIMEKINQDNSQYLEHTRIMRDFMVSRGMPIKLQTKVKRYLEYQFKSRKVVHQNHEVIQQLSPYLRIEITEHMNKVILEHHPFFAGMEQSVLSQVCTLARSELYAPGDIVLRRGQLSSLIVFIVRGQLTINDVRDGFDICLRAPAFLGDRGLFVTCELRHTVTCASHCEILTIAQQDLIDLVSYFPSAEAYIREYCKRVILNDESVIFCDFCHQSGHDIDNCLELEDTVNERSKSPVVASPIHALTTSPISTTAARMQTKVRNLFSKTSQRGDEASAPSPKALESWQNARSTQSIRHPAARSSQALGQNGTMSIDTKKGGQRGTLVMDVCDAWGDD